jgi:putative ABC transport system permease protein
MSPLIWLVQAAEGVGIAFDSIRSNKVRAGLTILGVAIGVFVVVALSSIVHGINVSFARELESAGPTSFFVYRRNFTAFQSCDGTVESCPDRRNPGITLDEARGIERLPVIFAVTSHIAGSVVLKLGQQSVGAGMEYYTPNWIQVDGGDISHGRNFTQAEYDGAARVVVLNDVLLKELFGEGAELEALGKTVLVNGVPCRVIGIYRSSGSPMGTPTSAGGSASPKGIMPIETGRRHLQVWMRSNNLIVKPRAGVTAERAIDDVTAYLRERRGLKPGRESNFAIITQDRVMAVYNQLFGTIFLVGLALASVGLLVGGVGVIAIMMISVTERTSEIGIRKALGATRANILWQFLVESATLTAIGAGVGLLLGITAALGIRYFWPVIPAATPASAIAAALAASAFTGILFGIMPAMRAARLDPVTALRHE